MRLLVLGWKPGSAEIFRRLGIKPIVVLGWDEAATYSQPNEDDAETVIVRDVSDVGRVLQALARAGHGAGTFDCVYTDHEFAIIPAAVLAGHFGCAGMPVAAALAARDKWLQKRLVAEAGVPVADGVLVPNLFNIPDGLLARVEYPAMLKPVSSAGGRNTRVVASQDDARAALAGIGRDALDAEAFLLERVITGREVHLDGVIRDGRVEFCSAAVYPGTLLARRKRATVCSISVDPREHPQLYREGHSLATRALAALGLRDSAFHLEAFDTPAGLVFGECGARTGGGYVVDLVKAKFGYDIRAAAAHIAVGRAPEEIAVTRPGAFAWTYLPAPLGTITELPTVAEILARDGVLQAETLYRPDSTMRGKAPGSAQKAGLALLGAANGAEADRRLDGLTEWFHAHARTTLPE